MLMHGELHVNNERYNAPSASLIGRLEKCPASWKASVGMESTDTEAATSGTRIHAALETGDFAGLTDDEERTAEMCRNQLEQIGQEWTADWSALLKQHEDRLVMTTVGAVFGKRFLPETAEVRFSGQFDGIAINGDSAMLWDYKTMRGDYDAADENAQLRALAVLAAKAYKLKSIRVSLIQPWKGRPTVADYDEVTLNAARIWLNHVLDKAENATESDFKAGQHCQHCPAKSACKAFQNAALEPIKPLSVGLPSNPKEAREEMFRKALRLEADHLAEAMDNRHLARWYLDAIESAALRRAETDEDFRRFYTLKDGVVKAKITDVQLVWARLAELGVSAADFSARCTITKKDLTELVKTATGRKGKELDFEVAAVLNGATTETQSAKTVVKVS